MTKLTNFVRYLAIRRTDSLLSYSLNVMQIWRCCGFLHSLYLPSSHSHHRLVDYLGLVHSAMVCDRSASSLTSMVLTVLLAASIVDGNHLTTNRTLCDQSFSCAVSSRLMTGVWGSHLVLQLFRCEEL